MKTLVHHMSQLTTWGQFFVKILFLSANLNWTLIILWSVRGRSCLFPPFFKCNQYSCILERVQNEVNVTCQWLCTIFLFWGDLIIPSDMLEHRYLVCLYLSWMQPMFVLVRVRMHACRCSCRWLSNAKWTWCQWRVYDFPFLFLFV